MARQAPPTRVLVADDSLEVAQRICSLLEECGTFEVVGPVRDGIEALRLFEECAPRAVILDFSMPGCSGLEALRVIRESGRSCFVIVLTFHLDPIIENECMEAGADCFLSKTQDFTRLARILNSFRNSDIS